MSDPILPLNPSADTNKLPSAFSLEQEKSLQDYLVILQKRWLLILFVIVLFLIGGILYTAYQVPTYRATAQIAILTPPIRTIGTMQVEQDDFRSSSLRTHQEILKSRTIAKKVLEQLPNSVCLSFFNNSRNNLSESVVLRVITVDLQKDTDILAINCDGTIPADCALIANLLVEVFVQENNKQKVANQWLLLNWIKEELPKIETKIAKNREIVFKFEEDHPELLFVSQDQNSFGTNAIDMLKRELQDVKIGILTQGLQYEKCQQARKSGSLDAILTLEFFDQNPLIEKLKQQKFDIENQLNELKLRYKDTHPQIIWLKDAIVKLERKVYQEAELLMRRRELQYLDLKEKAAQLEKLLQEEQSKNLKAKKKYLEYDRYRREYDSLQKMYSTLVDKMKELDILAGYRQDNIRIVDLAVPPLAPYKPSKRRNYMLSCLLGLIASLMFVFLLESLKEQSSSPEEVQKIFGSPIHGFVPFISSKHFSGQTSFAVQEIKHSAVAEAFRTIGTAIFFSEKNDPDHCFVVSSPGIGEGKTTLICNLGFTIAQAGYKVLVVDGDLRKPRLSTYLGLKLEKRVPGFTQLLKKETTLEEAVLQVNPNFYCIPSGMIPQNSYECIYNSDLKQIFHDMQQKFQYVLVDSPPLGITSDAFLLGNVSRKLLLVISMQNTQPFMLEQLAQKIRTLQIPIHGLILNDRDGNLANAHNYYRRYYKYYSETNDNKK